MSRPCSCACNPEGYFECYARGRHYDTFQAVAVYSTVVSSRRGGKAQILRFDETGTRVRLSEEASTETDSPKHGLHRAAHHSFTGVRMGAPLPFSSTTTNLAGSVLLALRPTT